jgi:hypothetical protein
MKLVRNIALALSLSLAGGAALSGTALAEHRDDDQQPWGDDDNGRWDRDRDDDWDRGDRDGWDRGDRDRPGRWGHLVPVRFVNQRDQFVTLYLNGRFLGRVAPNSRERIALPPGYHTVTYQVGHRPRYHQIGVSAFRGQRNRVVIEGWRGRGWGGWGW